MLSLVAVQSSRGAARRASCNSNLHQISVAMRTFAQLHKRAPNPPSPGQVSGWTIDLLPFLEESNLAEMLRANPSLDPNQLSPLVRRRPTIFTCPAAYEGDSEVKGVPAAHYVFFPPANRRLVLQQGCKVTDVPLDCRLPWAAGTEFSALPPVTDQTTGPRMGDINEVYIRE